MHPKGVALGMPSLSLVFGRGLAPKMAFGSFPNDSCCSLSMEMDCGVRIGAERAAGCVVGVGLAPVPCIQATLRSVAVGGDTVCGGEQATCLPETLHVWICMTSYLPMYIDIHRPLFNPN